jgi:hypothetical protein
MPWSRLAAPAARHARIRRRRRQDLHCRNHGGPRDVRPWSASAGGFRPKHDKGGPTMSASMPAAQLLRQCGVDEPVEMAVLLGTGTRWSGDCFLPGFAGLPGNDCPRSRGATRDRRSRGCPCSLFARPRAFLRKWRCWRHGARRRNKVATSTAAVLSNGSTMMSSIA